MFNTQLRRQLKNFTFEKKNIHVENRITVFLQSNKKKKKERMGSIFGKEEIEALLLQL